MVHLAIRVLDVNRVLMFEMEVFMAEKKAKPTQPIRPNIHLPQDLEPVYSNIVRIAHTPSELMFDFARILPGDPSAPVVSRVLLSPLSAKLFLNALSENLNKYEAVYGEINIPQKQSLAEFLFKPPQSPEDPKEE
jgi:hypothetical protein